MKGLHDLIVKLADVLGLIVEKEEELLAEDIEKLIEERQAARKERILNVQMRFVTSCWKRNYLEDTREGVKWKRA